MVNAPQFTRPAAGLALTWLTQPLSDAAMGREVRTRERVLGGEDRPQVVIDSSANQVAALILEETPWWVVDHLTGGSEAGEIRFVREREGAPTVVGQFPNPFATPFRAVALSSTSLLLSGALQESYPEAGVVTLLLRFETHCP